MDSTQKPNPMEHGTFTYERKGDTLQLQVAGISIAELAQIATGLMLSLPAHVRALAMLDLVQRIDNPGPGTDLADTIADSIGGGIKDGSAVHRVDADGKVTPVSGASHC
ncbi:MAG: hypothetical protein M3Y45_05325 [Actinomycetota bacterium]|nr:hypothetical protein [Actinomycetota bacterium]